MFNEMRRKDRMINFQECQEILEKAEYGTLSTISENGYPYSVPLNYCYLDNTIYFHCAASGKKLSDLEFSDKVSFSVVGNTHLVPEKFSTKFESVIIFGKAAKTEGEDKEKALLALVLKYSPAFYEQGKHYIKKAAAATTVVKLSIEHITGKASR